MFVAPMLATKGDHVPPGDAWVHEVKWDGMRVMVEVAGGRVRLWSRNGNDVTVTYPELQGLAELSHDVVIDGEIIALLDGVPRFGALADRMHVKDPRRAAALAEANPVTLLCFDIVSVDGRDLTAEPWSMRRQFLEALELEGDRWQTPPVYDDGPGLLRAAEAQGLEGIVSKRRTSTYTPGLRSKSWLKFPIRPTGSYVVGGWRYETDSRSRIGAILVGEPTDDGLVYRGRVGSGIAGKAGPRLQEMLAPLEVAESPFHDEIPREDAVGTVWVSPTIVVEVASLGLTPQQRLRQPAFLGIRTDLEATDA